MLETTRMTAVAAALLLGAAAEGQATSDPVLSPAEAVSDQAAELLYLESLRQAANSPRLDPQSDSEDTIIVEAQGPGAVVCSWRTRSGSNFRERRCKTRFQAERERQQAVYTLRRIRGF
ncbi:hypothetical protein [Maricaulis sp.]|uniref:hypothetical protein n=1 Tax=Maricaulis sp. TaxID=1486257 RepID=UPI003A943076